jgi:L,D-transpeptidase catalytic domain
MVIAAAPAVANAAPARPKTPATPAPGTSKPKPPAQPTAPATTGSAAEGSLALYMFDAFYVARRPVTVPHRVVHITGIVRPFVAAQSVTVRAFLGNKRLKFDRLRIKPSANRALGRFAEKLVVPAAGRVSVEIAHHRTAEQVGFLSRRSFTVLAPSSGFGSSGSYVQLVQERLAALHFYIPQTGVYDQGTGLAVDAYHRMLGHGVSEQLDASTAKLLLDGAGRFKVRFRHNGKHAEGDLSRQLLALVNGSQVYRIYPISSGKPSTPTVLGNFRVYLKDPGYLPDGMYFSNFFTGGYAIHGYDPAPDYPASHGCMRLPIVDAIGVYNWLDIGDGVNVYDE